MPRKLPQFGGIQRRTGVQNQKDSLIGLVSPTRPAMTGSFMRAICSPDMASIPSGLVLIASGDARN
ncbi:hypothetical protein BT96DRAFT_928031 [Gymnopus androsaceus JB14]|uniref:Uncharacterized protein n=1 Tax=Gymnopus androsaceus JB14 TaxID=1447944 RepID=A0A6A4GN63_9AGAR|nr:hypothetical protein BT96DRAFT_928031 [Gymnopus androsaceus JB14]